MIVKLIDLIRFILTNLFALRSSSTSSTIDFRFHYPCLPEICSLRSAQTTDADCFDVCSEWIVHIHHQLFGCLLISHHLIAPSVDAEKNSVLVLEVIQSVWFAEFFLRIVGGNGEKKR